MQIRLHIGFHKCGSTAVQFGLARSRPALAAHRIIYPSAHRVLEAHHLLPWALEGGVRPELKGLSPEQLVQAWLAEAAGDGARTIILSSEEFELLSAACLRRLRGLLEGHDVRVYAYVRPQDEYLVAQYKQFVRMPATAFGGDFREFLSAYQTFVDYSSDYGATIARWSEVFGDDHMIITSYDRGGLVRGDVFADFLAAADLPAIPLPVEREHNVSWTNLTARIMARMNRTGVATDAREDVAEKLDAIVRRLGLEVALLSPDARSALLSRYRPGNQRLLMDFRVRGNAGNLLDWPQAVPWSDTDAAMVSAMAQFIAEVSSREPPSITATTAKPK